MRCGRIAEIGTRVRAGSARLVDVDDRLLLPRFIGCRVHVGTDAVHPAGAYATDATVAVPMSALLVLRGLSDRGISAVCDPGTFLADPITGCLLGAATAGRHNPRRPPAAGTKIHPRHSNRNPKPETLEECT